MSGGWVGINTVHSSILAVKGHTTAEMTQGLLQPKEVTMLSFEKDLIWPLFPQSEICYNAMALTDSKMCELHKIFRESLEKSNCW